ncbi:hypothetical protein AMJ85_05820 [candidate division BRC1 bacterium SM23_51]|nr:MAG: hypothetical protein AMJ85_05820 [candidate division BRC1 bacterium SM23_51]
MKQDRRYPNLKRRERRRVETAPRKIRLVGPRPAKDDHLGAPCIETFVPVLEVAVAEMDEARKRKGDHDKPDDRVAPMPLLLLFWFQVSH